ncbi:hypothetical protein [Herpetosiphon sp. NSE202]|uniref:hypothetical protein n=1 Tax=Herpetosiphon sp. NSE202 TaxID=3351349 RepID=UPI0036250F2F
MDSHCAACQGFITYAERCLQRHFQAHQFVRQQCDAQHGGRECLVLYHSPMCNALLMLSDGEYSVALGRHTAPFLTNQQLKLDGSQGWYNVLDLLDRQANQLQRLWHSFNRHKSNDLAWVAKQLDGKLAQLITLFN